MSMPAGRGRGSIAHYAIGPLIVAQRRNVDPMWSRFYSNRMREQELTKQELEQLEVRLNELLDMCKRLREENRSLRESQEALVVERADLVAQTERARSRVEAMIGRLKAMERHA